MAAAAGLYRRYLATSDAISNSGGARPERISELVTEPELVKERRSASYLQEQHLRILGATDLVKLELRNADLRSGSMSAYTCVDFSKTKVLDRSGNDVTPAKRSEHQTTVSHFAWVDGGLRVEGVEAWSGDSIC